jgi:D-alanyl-D-alanine dipeptidase
MNFYKTLELVPIDMNYQWEINFIESIKIDTTPTSLSSMPGTKLLHSYAKLGYAGTLPEMYCRKSVIMQLTNISHQLGPDFCLDIFDAFRTKETQMALFMDFSMRIAKAEPHLSPTEVLKKTRTFVAHPEEQSRFPVPPHNSGGAIDLTLSYCGVQYDMGTDFDDTTSLSKTDYFESEFDSSLAGVSQTSPVEISI